MSKVRWDRLKDLFAETLDLAPRERAARLDSLVVSEPELGRELAALLHHHDQATTFLEEPATDLGLALVPPAPPPEHHIGAYRVVSELGSGGMGSVYLAERDDELFDQKVAIKIVRPDMSSGVVQRRFEAEMRILAQLEHPNIARLLDGGITPEGRAYFVMEYVEGASLTKHCEEGRLDLNSRLMLFEAVCDAVQFAHQNLVIHRDLKPSNILVDGRGHPKLLDFGIAKLIPAEALDVELTRTEGQFLTTGYASPEQIRREPLTTAADVYSLGVLLYELLTGSRPFDVSGMSPADTERTIVGERPTRPSVTASDQKTGVPARSLRGDLDTIVLKALRKEPGRRYASAQALAEDLRRFRTGLPISARADSWGYRTTKFLQRNRWGVAAATLVMATAAAGAMAVLHQSAQVREERDRAAAVSGVLVDIFRSSDPRALGQSEVTARELLDRGLERVDSRFSGDPATHAALLDVIGQAYQNVGEFAGAQRVMERSLSLRQELGGAATGDVAQSLNDLGNLALLRNDATTAEPLLIEALALRRQVFTAPHAELAQSLNNLGQLRLATRDFAGADTLLSAALAMQRTLYTKPHRDLAITLQARGLLHQIQGEFEEAEALYGEAVAMQREVLGNPHPDLAQTLNNLGLLLQTRGEFAAGEPLLRESLEMRESMLGSEHPMVGVGLHNLGRLLTEQGDPIAARPLLERALAVTEQTFGPEHPQTATVLNNLGDALRRAGLLDESNQALEASLRIRQTTLPAEHPHLAYSYHALGSLRFAQGRTAEADAYFDDAYDLRLRTVGESHPDLAATLHEQGVVAASGDRWERARERYERALGIREAALAPGHPHTTATRVGLGLALCRTGRVSEGLAQLHQAQQSLEGARTAEDPIMIAAGEGLTVCGER